MSSEIIVTMSLSVTKGGMTVALPFSARFDMAGANMAHLRQTIGTSEEAINMGVDITIPGWFMAINRDSTNYIEIRQGTGIADLVRLNAGEACCFRLAADATAPFAIADTAACELE